MKSSVFLLTIGDEILDGRIQNTNVSYLGEQLKLNGFYVCEHRTVSDSLAEIKRALSDAQRATLVLITGGLGPTNDDRTMQAAASFFRAPLVITKESKEHVASRYHSRGMPVTAFRKKLMYIPKGSKILQNPTGTAPGVVRAKAKTTYVFLPGPPGENRPMFSKDVLPLAKSLLAQRSIEARFFWRTFGFGEGNVYDRISNLIKSWEKKYPESFNFGVHISFPYIDLTMEIWKNPNGKMPSQKEITAFRDQIQDKLSDICFTRERESLPEVVFRELNERRLTLSSAESCTGGLLSKWLTDIPHSSQVFSGGVVTYANEAKTELLGVTPALLQAHGAVSEEVVRVMAQSIREKLGTTFGISLSGISGPTGGTEDKPIGTIHIALATKAKTLAIHQVILVGKGSREQNRIIAVNLALNLLRKELLLGSYK